MYKYLITFIMLSLLSGCSNATPKVEDGWYRPHEEWDYFYVKDHKYNLNEDFAQKTFKYLEGTWSTEDDVFNLKFDNNIIYFQINYNTFLEVNDYYVQTKEIINTETNHHTPEGVIPTIIIDKESYLSSLNTGLNVSNMEKVNISFYGVNEEILEKEYIKENFESDIQDSLLVTFPIKDEETTPLFLYRNDNKLDVSDENVNTSEDNTNASEKNTTSYQDFEIRVNEAISNENMENLSELQYELGLYMESNELSREEESLINSLMTSIDDYRFADDIDYMESLSEYQKSRESYGPVVEYAELDEYLGNQRGWIADDGSYQLDFILGSDRLFVYPESNSENSQYVEWTFDVQWQLIYIYLESGDMLYYDVIRNEDQTLSIREVNQDQNSSQGHDLLPAY